MDKSKWTIILLGITGDLSKRKIIPALYSLVKRHESIGLIIGTGRESNTVDEVLERAKPFIEGYENDTWKKFVQLVHYQKLEFDNGPDFVVLEKLIKQEQEAADLQNSPRLVYLATAADFFCMITDYLVQAGVVVAHDSNYRVVYEKPFGWDLSSAMHINACIKQALAETQVYRIDHYLAKEFVSNILLMRYSNTLFKSIWSNACIEAIKILFYETVGIEGRGFFYDAYGALKDVVQNHVLQILALVTMDSPASLDAESIRDKKAEILRTVHIVNGVLGQYEGYQEEQGVKPDSRTETYAALKLFIDHPRWYGVPFYIEAGKEMERKSTEIQITLKPIDHCPWSSDGVCGSNTLTIRITPQEGFSLQVNTKKPGTLNETTAVQLDFRYASVFGPISVQAYEVLLQEIMTGQQSSVVRFDEIEYQWDIIEKVLAMHLPLFTYKRGSQGPTEAFALMHERGL